METIHGSDRVQEDKWWLNPENLNRARPQQIDPVTGDLYPWWIAETDETIIFDHKKYKTEEYRSKGITFDIGLKKFEDPFKLENLRVIDPEEVKRALSKIIEEAEKYPDKPLTIFVGHGGTITMSIDEHGKKRPKFYPEQLLQKMRPDQQVLLAYSCFNMPTMIDSSQNKIDYMADIAIAMSWIYQQLVQYDRSKRQQLLDDFFSEQNISENDVQDEYGTVLELSIDNFISSQSEAKIGDGEEMRESLKDFFKFLYKTLDLKTYRDYCNKFSIFFNNFVASSIEEQRLAIRAFNKVFLQLIKDIGILDRFGGFIVCHGTDTLCQAQSYLSVMLGSNCPFNVYFVAAQKTTEDDPTDVYENFGDALDAASKFSFLLAENIYPFKKTRKYSEGIGIHGLCVGGKWMSKENTQQVVARGIFSGFTSKKDSDRTPWIVEEHNPNGPIWFPWGDFSGNNPNLKFNAAMREAHKRGANGKFQPLILRGHSDVIIITPEMGENPEKIKDMISASHPKAIIMPTYGSFTMDKEIVDAVFEASSSGPIERPLIFAVNPFPSGSIAHDYPDATYLVSRGIIPLKMLAHSAAAKLDWAFKIFGHLPTGDMNIKIIKFMTENHFRGEQLIPPQPDECDRKILDQSLYFKLNDPDRILMYAMNYPEFRSVIQTTRTAIHALFITAINKWLQYEHVQQAIESNGYHYPTPAAIQEHITDVMEGDGDTAIKSAMEDSLHDNERIQKLNRGEDIDTDFEGDTIDRQIIRGSIHYLRGGIDSIIDGIFSRKDKDMKPLFVESCIDRDSFDNAMYSLMRDTRLLVLGVHNALISNLIPPIGQPEEYKIPEMPESPVAI